ncbi:unnamed protein product [Adineta steineri]|uniref:UDP-glucuronosyltransferase n=1 Tax=Adineta steineri TaxID=433720 RepID=A0A813WUD2_9BILA|nr:unnamed protein product [Adineta steineri]CAF3888579.1 unnamed protein product [Adineta steineri]
MHLVLDWVSQRFILAHLAVKLFISHGGWNSVLESMSAENPMLILAMLGDQFLNGHRIEHEFGTGRVIRNTKSNGHQRLITTDEINLYIQQIFDLKMAVIEKAQQLQTIIHHARENTSREHVNEIINIINLKGVNVICFSLNKSFKNKKKCILTLVLHILTSTSSTQIIDAQHENTKKQHQGTLNTIGDDGNSEIDGTENDGTGDKLDRKNNRNNIPDRKKPFDRNNDDDNEDRADQRDHMPDRKNNRNNRPDKTKPYNRNNDEDFDDSGELLPSKDRKRKHWKKDKHMQKHKYWKKKKHGKHHHGHEHHRKHHHHHHHHRHHHDDKNHRHRKPNHRKPEYNEEDEFIDKNKSNKDQYSDSPASRRNPTNTDDYNSDRNINNRNNDHNIGE